MLFKTYGLFELLGSQLLPPFGVHEHAVVFDVAERRACGILEGETLDKTLLLGKGQLLVPNILEVFYVLSGVDNLFDAELTGVTDE